MAIMPGPGTYLNNFMSAYQDNKSNTGTFLELPSIVQITDYHLFGGRYIAGLYPGISISKDQNSTRFAATDAYLMPVAFNWQWSHFSILAYEGIIAPTGYYDKNSLSTSRNVWTFDHILSLTWQLPADNELSTTLGIMNNLENPATHYKSGNELHFDYTLGHYLMPEFAIGIAGSYYQQISRDQAPLQILATQTSEASSVGPVVMLSPHLLNRDITLSVKWLHEYYAQGRLNQDYLVCRLFMPF